MKNWFDILFAVLLFVNIFFLVLCGIKRRNVLWILLYVYEVFSIAVVWVVCAYYNGLPGTGMFPGLTYFKETMHCLFWLAGFLVILISSGVTHAIIQYRSKMK